jgi:hypothetical protein
MEQRWLDRTAYAPLAQTLWAATAQGSPPFGGLKGPAASVFMSLSVMQWWLRSASRSCTYSPSKRTPARWSETAPPHRADNGSRVTR